MSNYIELQSVIEGLPLRYPEAEMGLEDCYGCVLREEITADEFFPTFDKSAVDGYACRKEDLEHDLEVLEIIPAGKPAKHQVEKHQCSKIMTGAAVPGGADCVFMVEDAEQVNEKHVRCTNPKTKLNILIKGEDYRPGDILLEKGTILGPQHLAVIAGVGKVKVKVSKMPSVGLIVTGSELVPSGEKPADGKIRDTNSIQLRSLLKNMNLSCEFYGIVEDDYGKLLSTFRKALFENELVIVTGGAAVGDFDLVPGMLDDEGFEVLWTRTGLKPGNPMSFARKEQKFVFGLSGNPVSSFVQFVYLVKPSIYRLLGASFTPIRIRARVKKAISRKNGGRLGIIPVKITDGEVEELRFNGSGHLTSLPGADAFLEFPVGKLTIESGEEVYVRPI